MLHTAFNRAVHPRQLCGGKVVFDAVLLCQSLHHIIFQMQAPIANPHRHDCEFSYPFRGLGCRCIRFCAYPWYEPQVEQLIILEDKNVLDPIDACLHKEEVEVKDLVLASCMELTVLSRGILCSDFPTRQWKHNYMDALQSSLMALQW